MIALLAGDYPPLDWSNSQPGYLALIVVIVLFASVAFLFRSFLKHARRAREPWEGDSTDDRTDGES